MIEDAEEIMAAVRESPGLVIQPENADTLNRIEQEIIEVQKAVLALHKAKQGSSVSATDYATQLQAYSQRMQELEVQQEEQKSVATRYAEVKAWLDAFEKHISADITERGHDYYMENRVRYINIDGPKGEASVEGSEPYEVEFEYKGGEISQLICSCFCSYNCKHEFAAMLQLKETLEII